MMRKLYSLVEVICNLTFTRRNESVGILDALRLRVLMLMGHRSNKPLSVPVKKATTKQWARQNINKKIVLRNMRKRKEIIENWIEKKVNNHKRI